MIQSRIRDSKKVYCILLIMAVCVTYFGALYAYPIQNVDEFSSVATPIILSGGDWSDIISITRWHGWGITIFLVPLCLLTSNGVIIYRCSLVLCLLLRVFLALLTYEVVIKFCKLNNKYAFMISIVCSIGILEPSDGRLLSNMTEIPITLMCVVWIYLVQSIFHESDQKKKVFCFLVPIAIIYSFSMHSRAVIMLIAMCITLLPLSKKVIYSVEPRELLIGGILGLKWYLLINQSVNNSLYNGISDGLNTASYVVSSQAPKLMQYSTDQEVLIKIFSIVASIFSSYTLYSFGFFSFIVVAVINIIYRAFKKRKFDFMYMCATFAFLSWIGINVGIAIQNVNACYNGKYAWFTYLRYSLPFMWIMLICALVYYYEEKVNVIDIILSEMISIISLLFLKLYTIKILDESGYGMTNTIFRRLFYNNESVNAYYLKLLVICVLVQILVVMLLTKRKKKLVLLLYILPAFINTVQLEYNVMRVSEEKNKVLDTFEQLIEKYGDNYDLMYAGSEDFIYSIRVGLNDKEISYCMNSESLSDKTILVTNEENLNGYSDFYIIKITDGVNIISKHKILE